MVDLQFLDGEIMRSLLTQVFTDQVLTAEKDTLTQLLDGQIVASSFSVHNGSSIHSAGPVPECLEDSGPPVQPKGAMEACSDTFSLKSFNSHAALSIVST